MEQLIKDLEKTWELYKDHNDHARLGQMIACVNDMISTCEIIKHKCVNTLIELR